MVNPLWSRLIAQADKVAARLTELGAPKLRVVVDGKVAYWALAVPRKEDLEAHAAFPGQSASSLEAWVKDRLTLLAETWPKAQEVELLALWAGNPPRLERVVRLLTRPKEVAA
ncbi:hypothetical protein [Thermus scotoductus]|uniref:hypothetical protein n=1 Tax=Thermus scotoductus TaxID=37636 RepID=UPI0020A51BA6|nr:hypothetical protein [Thermus scotoductus]